MWCDLILTGKRRISECKKGLKMKTTKKVSIIFLVAILFAVNGLWTIAAETDTVKNARDLYDLGLLKGTGTSFSEEGLALDRNATRAEICVTIVRMLGKEAKAAYQQNGHPFADVPAWASDCVGWLYENYLVNGVGPTYFGAQDIATVQQFSAMLLRVLGYNDSRGDFAYENATNVAIAIGLTEADAVYKYELSRKDMINMCHRALRLPIQNSTRFLIRKLCEEGAVDSAAATKLGLLVPPSVSDAFKDVPQNIGGISVSQDGGAIRIHLDTPLEHYGVRVFMQDTAGSGAREVKYQGTPYMQKGEIEYIGGGSSGYIRDIYIYGLDVSRKYEFIVLKTSSEAELYQTWGKSIPAWN